MMFLQFYNQFNSKVVCFDKSIYILYICDVNNSQTLVTCTASACKFFIIKKYNLWNPEGFNPGKSSPKTKWKIDVKKKYKVPNFKSLWAILKGIHRHRVKRLRVKCHRVKRHRVKRPRVKRQTVKNATKGRVKTENKICNVLIQG